MSHEITSTDTAMFAMKPAWHGLGTVVDHAPDSAEAIKLAGLGWTVEQEPIYDGAAQVIDTHQLMRRSDNGKVLGVVGEGYTPVQNVEAFSILDDLHKDGVVKYESAFSIRGGKVVILLAQLGDGSEVTEGDIVKPYVMLSNAHDGTKALSLKPTSVRVVCANTWRMALAQKSDIQFSFRHTENIKDRAKVASEMIGKVMTGFQGNIETARKMAERKLNGMEWTAFLDEVAPELEGKAKDRSRDFRGRIVHAFRDGTLNQVGRMRGTAWAAFNAVTEVIDHTGGMRKEDTEQAFNRRMFGSGNELKTRAWELTSAMA